MTKTTKRYFYVKPVKKESAQGRHLWAGPDGKPMESTRAKGATTTLSVLKDRNGLLKSGLDYFVPNPYKAESAEKATLPSNWRSTDIWSKDQITRQEELEVKYNLTPGHLTNIPSRDRKKYTYLQLFRMRLEDRENVISLDNLKGEVFYELAKATSLVANSYEDIQFSPYAQFYISKVNEDEEIKASRNRLKAQGAAALEELKSKFGGSKLKQVASVLGLGNTLSLSEEAVYNRIYDFIDDSKHFQRNITLLLDVVDMMKSKARKPIFDATVLLRELVTFSILNESKGAFYWTSKRGTSLEIIGHHEEAAIQFLMNKDTEVHTKELQQELKIKKNEY